MVLIVNSSIKIAGMIMKKDQIRLKNICCYSCATTVEKEIVRLDGIKDALIDFQNGTMDIEYDESKIDIATIEEKSKEVIKRFSD